MTHETHLTGYDFEPGDSVYFYVPEQYGSSAMFIDGVETPVTAPTSGRWVAGVYKGQPKATAGHYVETVKPADGGLWLVDSGAPMKAPATAADMIRDARARK